MATCLFDENTHHTHRGVQIQKSSYFGILTCEAHELWKSLWHRYAYHHNVAAPAQEARQKSPLHLCLDLWNTQNPLTSRILPPSAEAVVRGHKSGLLSTSDYNNLCQCESLEDVKLHLVSPSTSSNWGAV